MIKYPPVIRINFKYILIVFWNNAKNPNLVSFNILFSELFNIAPYYNILYNTKILLFTNSIILFSLSLL